MPTVWARVAAVGSRQAFGLGFEPAKGDAEAYQRISDRRILLPPHPEWQFSDATPDWHADPFEQRNWRAQLHMLRWLDPLRRVNAGPSYTALWTLHVKDWIAKNADPGSTTLWAWKDMVDAMRAEVLLFGSALFDEPQPWLVDAIEAHGSWLSNEDNLGHSNHALHQHAALFQIGSALKHDSWQAVALERLREYFDQGYDAQGVNAEGAPGYWELNLRWANEVARRLEAEGADAEFVRRAIARSAEAIAHSTRPDGMLEAIGDTVSARPVGTLHAALEYVSTGGASGTPPAETTKVYDAGYVFGRTGWGETQRKPGDETFYSLLFGSANKVHGHQDGGSVTYYANSRPFLTEAGKYSYTTTPGRIYALGRAGHNVPTVLGASYDAKAEVELLAFRSTSRFDYFKLRDRGYKGVDLTREVVFAKASECLLIIDTVRASRTVEVESRWHLAPGAEIAQSRGQVGASYGKSEFSLVFGGKLPAISVVKGSQNPFEGWVSPRWHQLEATHLVKARQSGTAFRMVCAVQKVPDERQRLESIEVDGVRGFVVRGSHGTEFVSVLNGEVDIRTIDQSTGSPGPKAAERIDARPDEVRSVDRVVLEARRELWSGSVTNGTIKGLQDTLAAGIDRGVAATLSDIATSLGRADLQLPQGTRSGFPPRHEQEHAFVEGVLPTYFYRNPSELSTLPRHQDAVLLIEAGSLVLPVRYYRGTEPSLIVGFTGAIDRGKESLPRFERMRSLRGLGPSVLVFSDPTLDLAADLALGWYVGTATLDLVPCIAEVVRTVAREVGAKDQILLGSSGGGYAALQVSSSVPGARVLAINPQTDIRRYHKRFAEAALNAVFGSGAYLAEPSRVNVMERFESSEAAAARILYVSNVGDGHHVRHHAEPFRSWYEAKRPTFELDFRSVNWGRGHVGPTAKQFGELLRDVWRPMR